MGASYHRWRWLAAKAPSLVPLRCQLVPGWLAGCGLSLVQLRLADPDLWCKTDCHPQRAGLLAAACARGGTLCVGAPAQGPTCVHTRAAMVRHG